MAMDDENEIRELVDGRVVPLLIWLLKSTHQNIVEETFNCSVLRCAGYNFPK